MYVKRQLMTKINISVKFSDKIFFSYVPCASQPFYENDYVSQPFYEINPKKKDRIRSIFFFTRLPKKLHRSTYLALKK